MCDESDRHDDEKQKLSIASTALNQTALKDNVPH